MSTSICSPMLFACYIMAQCSKLSVALLNHKNAQVSLSMGMAHTSGHCLQIDACDEAYFGRVPVQHPLLDKVRQCSANPDQAASFFLQLFHPIPYKRIAAVDHAWTASTTSRIYDEMGLNCSTSAAAGRWSRIKQSCTRGLCAFIPCFGGTSPTVEADTHLTGSCSHPHTQDGTLLDSHQSGRTPSVLNQDKTSQSAAKDIDVPESVESQADSMQTAPSALQTCWNIVKKPFTGKYRPGNQQVCKGTTHSPAENTTGHVDMVEADKSALAPAADKNQQVLIRAVTASAVPGTPPELQVQDLQQQQQAISGCGQGLLNQKKGIVETEELLTRQDHKAAADVRQQGSSEEKLQKPIEVQAAESIR